LKVKKNSNMNEANKTLREELLEKMHFHSEEERKYRHEINLMDKKERKDKFDSYVGKYFKIDLEDWEKGTWHKMAYVSRYDDGFNIYGVQITCMITSEQEQPNWYDIDINHSLFEHDIETGEEVSKEVFDAFLKEALDFLPK
jgi:hypothetical protein